MLELYGNLFTGDGTSQAAINKPFWAKVTAYDGVKYYAWTEYVPENGVLVALPGGRFGTVTINPAWEPNGYLITINSYVLLRRADFSATYDWTYVTIAVTAPSGSPPGTTINYLTSTLNYDSSTINYQTSTSNYGGSTIDYNNTSQYLQATSGNPSNYNNTATSFLRLDPFTLFRYGPPSSSTSGGGIQFTAPTEICGYLFWCCSPMTLVTSTYDDLDLTMGGIVAPTIVFDVIPNSPDTTLHGIQPAFYGPPTNTGAITNATNATPIVLTVPGWVSQPAVGDCVKVTGVNGNTNANGIWTVQASTGTTLTLKDSAGIAPFAASPNSTIEMAGPQLIVLRNATAGTDKLIIDHLGGGGTSRASSYITLPPAYGTSSVTLEKYDSIVLWWDSCGGYQWRVLACTVQHTTNAGVKGEVGGAGLTANFRTTLNFLNGGGITWTVADNVGLSSLDISAAAAVTALDYKVKVHNVDTTPDYIGTKLVAGTNVSLTTNNPGANETLTIAATGSSLTLVSDSATLNADYTWGATGWETVGALKVTLHDPGTYIVTAIITGKMSASALGGWLVARLYDSVAGNPIAGTDVTVVKGNQTSADEATATIVHPVTTAGIDHAIVIQVNGSATTVSPKILTVATAVNGGTSMSYFRIA